MMASDPSGCLATPKRPSFRLRMFDPLKLSMFSKIAAAEAPRMPLLLMRIMIFCGLISMLLAAISGRGIDFDDTR